MKWKSLTALTIIAAISFLLAGTAYAQKKSKVVVEDKKVKKIEDKGAFLGIYMEELDDEIRKERDYPKSTGVLVTKVMEESPAEEAGIEDGDVIYLFGGETVESGKQLAEMVSSRKPGEKVEIVLYREGKKKTIDLALAEKKTSYVTIDIDDEDLKHSVMIMNKLGEPGLARVFGGKGGELTIIANRAVLGVSLHELSEDLAPYFDVKPGDGVLVLDVYEDSPAAEAGVKDGDVIVEIAGARVSKSEDVIVALEDLEDDTEVAVTVVRKGRKMDIPVKVEKDEIHTIGLMYPEYGKALKDFNYKYRVRMPETKAIRIQELDDEKLEQKMKELEKQIEELQKKLKDLEKSD